MAELSFQEQALTDSPPTWWRGCAPSATLILLSPVLAELLMGSLSLSKLWLPVPEMGVHGCAALIIRFLARRQRRGCGTISSYCRATDRHSR